MNRLKSFCDEAIQKKAAIAKFVVYTEDPALQAVDFKITVPLDGKP